MLWDEMPEPIFDNFNFFAYVCETCEGLSLLGCFRIDEVERDFQAPPYPRLYPVGPDIDPPMHTVSGGNPIPEPVLRAYREAWPLQHTAPGAFANQIRRALEFICDERRASGNTLYERLQFLAASGAFPPGLVEVSTLIREVGNIGSHASEKEVSRWDAELLDALFRMILEYRGPQKAPTKLLTTVRLDADVIAFFKAQGRGYQTRINEELRKVVAKGLTSGSRRIQKRAA